MMKNWKTITSVILAVGGIGALIGSDMLDEKGTRLIMDYGDRVNGGEVKQAAHFVKYLAYILFGGTAIFGFLSFKSSNK